MHTSLLQHAFRCKRLPAHWMSVLIYYKTISLRRARCQKNVPSRHNRAPHAPNRNEITAPREEVIEGVRRRKPFQRVLKCEGAPAGRLKAGEGAGTGVCVSNSLTNVVVVVQGLLNYSVRSVHSGAFRSSESPRR